MDIISINPFTLFLIALNHGDISTGLLPMQNEALEIGNKEAQANPISASFSFSFSAIH